VPATAPAVAVAVLAGGSGSRAGQAGNKVLLPLGGEPVFARSLRTVAGLREVRRVLLVVADRDRGTVEPIVAERYPGVELVAGGATRHESEWQALTALAGEIDTDVLDVVVLHDAARPLARLELFEAVIRVAAVSGGAVPVRPVSAVVAGSDEPAATSDGHVLVGVQTPQAFQAGPLLAAYRAAEADGFRATDTASCVERYTDLAVRSVEGPADNVKITFPGDVELVRRLLAGQASPRTA
jgi:2-C-methyl-D-erythritol 4-phosphate cytidylyltransferase